MQMHTRTRSSFFLLLFLNTTRLSSCFLADPLRGNPMKESDSSMPSTRPYGLIRSLNRSVLL